VANDDETVPNFKPDVPSASTALAKSPKEVRELARKVSGQDVPNECLFCCITCGWKGTIRFEEVEIEALGGDITAYGGPCTGCDSMTLTPHDSLFGRDVQTIFERAKKHRLEEARENADVLVGRLREEVVSVMTGSTLHQTPEEHHDPAQVHDPRPPGQRAEDLPDADDVAIDGLKPRRE